MTHTHLNLYICFYYFELFRILEHILYTLFYVKQSSNVRIYHHIKIKEKSYKNYYIPRSLQFKKLSMGYMYL